MIYLQSRDVSPVRSQLQTPRENASSRTKRHYALKEGQAVASVVRDISPSETGPLFKEVVSSEVLRRQLSTSDEESEEKTIDETIMATLAECYEAASNWSARHQILSLMAYKVSYRGCADILTWARLFESRLTLTQD